MARQQKQLTEAQKEAKRKEGAQKFEKDAVSRVTRATKVLRSLASMGRSRVYEFTRNDVERIASFLESEVRDVKAGMLLKFSTVHQQEEKLFALK